MMTAVVAVLLGAVGLHHPTFYSPPVANSIQKWGISTLREQINQHRVVKVAFYSDQNAVEVLDINGLQRKVDIFPAVAPMLVEDLHREHVPFFVAPDPPDHTMMVAFARSFVLTISVIFLIEVFGLMEYFIFGLVIVGNAWMRILEELGGVMSEACTEAYEYAAAGKRRHDDSLQALLAPFRPARPQSDPIPVMVEDDELEM